MVLTKNKKIIIVMIIVIFVITVLLATILGIYYAPRDIRMSDKTRRILSKTYDSVDLGEKAEPKRVIDEKNIVNLLNYYGNEDIPVLWGSIPENQKAITILLLIPGNLLNPKVNLSTEKLEKWADECERLKIPYVIQNINGETHMEERLPIAYIEERFASQHEYFYGLNVAELYNGISWRGEEESIQTEYIIDCIKLSAKFGGFFFWTDTNINYDNGMIVDYIENSEALYSTLKNYSKYVCMLNKESYGTPSTYAVMQGLWLAGLIGNWGVASDWWHWQVDGDKESLFGENDKYINNIWEAIISYPENMYVQSMMLVMSRGGTCFKAEAPNFSTSANGKTIAGYEYAISPLLNKIINGEISIPTREQVLKDTKAAILGGKNWVAYNYSGADSNLYPSTGNAGIIPLLPSNLRLEERAVFLNAGVPFIDYKMSFIRYQEIYGITEKYSYMTAVGTDWYYINPVENKRESREGKFTPRVNGATSVSINAAEHTSAIINESSNELSFYISNYRTDKVAMQKKLTNADKIDNQWVKIAEEYLSLDENGNPLGVDDSTKRNVTLKIKGSYQGGKPLVRYITNKDGSDANSRSYESVESWDAVNQVLTIEINQNGVVELQVEVDDSGKDLTYPDRSVIQESLLINNNDLSSLQELIIEDEILLDKHNYTYYSYLKYNNAVANAQMLISERTGRVKDIVAAKDELVSARNNLINISEYTKTLKKALEVKESEVTSLSYQEVTLKIDKMLRALLSVKNYKIGRTNNLTYSKSFCNSEYNRDEKLASLEKANKKLNEALGKLVYVNSK